MLEIRDDAAGLSVSLTREPEPRDPRLVEEPLFAVLTWGAGGLGDPHGWPSREAFMEAVSPDRAAVFALARVDTPRGPCLVPAGRRTGPVVGYAYAPFERLCLEMGLDEIAPAIRDEVLLEAEHRLEAELLAHEEFVAGRVYRYEVRDRWGRVLEARGDLYGEDHARHLARDAFERHLAGVGADGRSRAR